VSDLINPSAYGVLPTGFTRMRLPEIRQSIIDNLQLNTGLIFETRPDSITGQFIDTFAEREATLWELAEAVYHAMYPISATGVNLDHAVSFAGVRRLFAQTSSVWCACYGIEGTIIPAGSIISNSNTQDSFLLDDNVTITRQAAVDTVVAVIGPFALQIYWIQLNTTMYSYTAIAGDTTTSIAASLGVLLIASGYQINLNANQINIRSLDPIPYKITIELNLQFVEIGSLGNFTAENFGPVDATSEALNQIVSTINGWTKVYNPVGGTIGRDQETDDELRLRYNTGVFRLGAGTLESIKANLLQNVPNITNLEVYENENDVTDSDGRPPHSIEVIAYGGDPVEIANEIFLTKAAGIDTFGSVAVNVKDSSGYTHSIYFNRPVPAYIWVKIGVYLYNEEIFPDDGIAKIQAIVAATGNDFGIGKDVIIQRFLGPIYTGVPGIAQMNITVAMKTDPSTIPVAGDYGTHNIAITARQLSQFDVTHVIVTILTGSPP
jgi:uncharacterized phage protein gp47/JayE